jgi:peptidoglycan/LPS O-acetylase OafA/YrhL
LIFAVIFSSGVGLALLERRVGLAAAICAFFLLLCSFGLSGNPTITVLVAVAIAPVLFNLISVPFWLTPRTDISYGVYLYAFPVQQLTSNLTANFWLKLALTAASVTALAILSAKFVEQPILRWRKTLGISVVPSTP